MRLVYIALGWVAGIVLAAQVPALIPLLWLLLAGVAGAALVMAWDSPQRILFLALLAFALGGYRYAFVPQSSPLAQFNAVGGASIEGVVVSAPDVRDDRVQLQVEAERIVLGSAVYATSGRVLVNAPRFVEVQYGDRVLATGEMAAPAEYDTFSYADYLARQGVFSILQNATLEVLNSGERSDFFRALLGLKARLQDNINQALPDPQAALLSGILLGNERGIDPALGDDFNRVGAAHIIAISGFNMALIAGIVMGTLGSLVPRRWVAVLLGIAVLAAYTLLVGANAAVVRAALMSSTLVIGELFKRKSYVPASLALVALLMSLHQPLVLWDVSFQLSFFAVLGLALFTEPLTRLFDRLLAALFPGALARTFANLLNEPLVVSIAALIPTLPLTILYFQRLSLVSLLVNVLVVPVQSYLLFVGGLALIVSLLVPALAQVLFWIAGLLLSWTIGMVRLFAELPFADVVVSVDARLVGLFFLVIIGGAIMNATRPPWAARLSALVRRRVVLNAVLFAGLSLSLLLGGIALSRPDGRLHVWWLDVGHSNAVLLQTPGGAHVLVDGGRFPSRLLTALGDRLPFYDRTIEIIAISQPDEFDTGALPAVLARYDAGVILVNGQETLSPGYDALREAMSAYDVLPVVAGYRVALDDGVTLEVLHPQQPPELSDAQGDVALVLRVTYGERSLLLTSDLSRGGQVALLEAGQWPLAEVLHLPQHGTQRSLSESFLSAVQPQAVILQSDAANRRGDPALDTLALLGDTPLFRTDETGALHLWTDGETLWVQPER